MDQMPVDADQVSSRLSQVTYVGIILYNICLALTRASILLLYRRLFITNRFRLIVNITLAFVVAQCIAFNFAYSFRCTPARYAWDHSVKGGGHCVSFPLLFRVPSAINIVTDLFILALPIPMVWSLQVAPRRKIALTAIFVVGGLCVVTIPLTCGRLC